MPSDAELEAAGDRFCANRVGAVDEWFAAMDAGGRFAQIALVAKTFYTCPEDSAKLWDWLGGAIINDERMQSTQTALRYVEAMVDAADASGVGYCVTLVVLDPSSNAVLFNQAIHVGPGPESPEGCLTGFQQSQAICGNATTAPGSPCCSALGALGDSCHDILINSIGTAVSTAYDLLATSCGPFSNPLPAGEVRVLLRAGESGQCHAYDPSRTMMIANTFDTTLLGFVPIANSTWGPSANGSLGTEEIRQEAAEEAEFPGVPWALTPAGSSIILAVAARVCPLGAGAGPELVKAFAEGGEAAKAAAFVLTSIQACPGKGSADDQIAALSAFLAAPELAATSTVMSLVRNFVDACDQAGRGACVSVVIVDPTSKAALFEELVHTSTQILD